MAIRVVRLGTPRAKNEGLRLGTVRKPPRAVPKSDFAKRDYYDVWLPNLAPSVELMHEGQRAETEAAFRAFARRYRAEMKEPERAHLLDLLAAMSHGSDFAVGCYCADEARCHRSVLRELLAERGALFA